MLIKVRAKIIHYYDRIKHDFDKVWPGETIYKTDIDPHDTLDKDFDYQRFIDEKVEFKTEEKRFEI